MERVKNACGRKKGARPVGARARLSDAPVSRRGGYLLQQSLHAGQSVPQLAGWALFAPVSAKTATEVAASASNVTMSFFI